MANDKTMRVSSLDFQEIKANLISFMQAQDTFADYSFAGSALNTLIDLLSYNTYYNSIIANQLANETFLDSAVSRGSVVSHAKELGYYPRSRSSAKALTTITVNNPTGTPSLITLPKNSQFNTTIDGESYKFVTLEEVTTSPIGGVYSFPNIYLYEGTLNSYSYVVDLGNSQQKFIIPSQNVDLSTLRVYVQNSISDLTIKNYNESTDITKVTGTSEVYFIQGTNTNKYEVYFGDGILGKSVANGNVVILEYVISSGVSANGAKVFRAASAIAGSTSVAVTTIDISYGGSEFETIDSIKKNAPRAFSTQNRMVTVEDIRTLLPIAYPNIKSISVWGGEEELPPSFGSVFIAIEPLNYGALSASEKLDIINNIISERKMIGIQYNIIDPEYTYFDINVTTYYDKSISLISAEEIKTLTKNQIMIYNNTELSQFKGVFRYSKLSTLIDNVNPSIVSNIMTFRLKKYITPIYGFDTQYDIKFYNPIYTNPTRTPQGSVSSSGFTIQGDSRILYMDDDGNKYIRLYYLDNTSKIYINNNIGTIDYVTGRILLNLNISTFLPVNVNDTGISFTVNTQSNDIIPIRNMILRINEEDITTNAIVDALSDGNQSGINYSFTTSR